MIKPTILVPTRSDTNRAVQSQKMVRGLKFWIKKVEELFYPCSENKGADQLRSIFAFIFAYADCWFSHAAAQFIYQFHFTLYKSTLLTKNAIIETIAKIKSLTLSHLSFGVGISF